jgi:azurin
VLANKTEGTKLKRPHCGIMKTKRALLLSILCPIILAGPQAGASDVKTVNLIAYTTLRYSPNKIEARPGQKIVLTLKNESNLPRTAMEHDWVLLKAGSNLKEYAKAALRAKDDDYIPRSLAQEVIVSVPMLGPQESRTITFSAPKAPGSYPYLCSCPLHSDGGMIGYLEVK